MMYIFFEYLFFVSNVKGGTLTRDGLLPEQQRW